MPEASLPPEPAWAPGCKCRKSQYLSTAAFQLVKARKLGINTPFPTGSSGKESACNAGDWGSIPGLGRYPGEWNDNPLQYSCLGNPMDRGAWQAPVHGVTESDMTESLTLSPCQYPSSHVAAGATQSYILHYTASRSS